ncbi:Actin cross-linking toxin VgrG1 [Klebsiella spallanzanii]|nr:Actin cross-linking toxin VgrG1 [Klebsiella spallanzanii]
MSSGLRFTLDVDGLSPDTFAVVSFHYTGSYSSLFRLDVGVSSARFTTLNHESTIEKDAILKIWQGDTQLRHVKGIVASFSRHEYDGQRAAYQMEIRPPFWRSIYRQNFRSFQNQDIAAIITTLLAENGVTEYSLLLGNKHPAREFCVQYGESDYAFLLRLLSEEGISFFEAFADDAAYLPPPIEIPFNPNITSGSADEYVSQISHTVQIRPSSVVSKDYTFKRPGWQGKFKEDGANLDWQRSQYEIFDYPGRFKDEQHGRDFTRYQMDGFRSNAEVALCESNSPKLWAGQRLTLTEHPLESLNATWQVVASELYGEQPQAKPGQPGQGTWTALSQRG